VRIRFALFGACASVVSLFATAGFVPAQAECLAAPNAPSPPGSHWFYRLDRVDHHKCWYLGPLNRKPNAGASEAATPGRRVAKMRPGEGTTAAAPSSRLRATEPAEPADTPQSETRLTSAFAAVLAPEPIDQASMADSAPEIAEAEDAGADMPLIWPDPPPRENAQPNDIPARPGLSWISLIACLVGAVMAARYLPAVLIDYAASRRFDEFAHRLRVVGVVGAIGLGRAPPDRRFGSLFQPER
jgi:hypothetical protein